MNVFSRRISALGFAVLVGCVQAPSVEDEFAQELALLPDGALWAMCDCAEGLPNRPVTLKDRGVALEVFKRLRVGRLSRASQRVMQWLTAEQTQQLEAAVNRSDPRASSAASDHGPSEELRWVPLSLENLSARSLYELVAGSRSGSELEWPNDAESIALRLAVAHPERVASVLSAGAALRTTEDAKLASWCVRSLVRMQRWRAELLQGNPDDRVWYRLKLQCADAFDSSEQWHAFAAALQGVGVESLGGDPVAAWERSIGEFYAQRGDEAGLPKHLNYGARLISDSAWEDVAQGSNVQLILEAIQIQRAIGMNELMPIHVVGAASPSQVASLRRLAPTSYAAKAALCEIGDADARESLFWGVEAGVRAAHHAMDGDQAKVAWRSGCMIPLLEKALEHGGDWLFWARFWLGEGNHAVVDLEGAPFRRRLRAVLSSADGVSAARSPFTGGWGLVPSREVAR